MTKEFERKQNELFLGNNPEHREKCDVFQQQEKTSAWIKGTIRSALTKTDSSPEAVIRWCKEATEQYANEKEK